MFASFKPQSAPSTALWQCYYICFFKIACAVILRIMPWAVVLLPTLRFGAACIGTAVAAAYLLRKAWWPTTLVACGIEICSRCWFIASQQAVHPQGHVGLNVPVDGKRKAFIARKAQRRRSDAGVCSSPAVVLIPFPDDVPKLQATKPRKHFRDSYCVPEC